MSNPNTSEKSVYLDREEHVHKGQVSGKRVVLYLYDSNTDTLIPYESSSAVSATLDHGSNRDIDTTAEQITSTSFACSFGVTLKADITNTGIIYIGNSDVTAGSAGSTDGFPLSPGETLTLEVSNPNLLYAIASVANQIIYWTAV